MASIRDSLWNHSVGDRYNDRSMSAAQSEPLPTKCGHNKHDYGRASSSPSLDDTLSPRRCPGRVHTPFSANLARSVAHQHRVEPLDSCNRRPPFAYDILVVSASSSRQCIQIPVLLAGSAVIALPVIGAILQTLREQRLRYNTNSTRCRSLRRARLPKQQVVSLQRATRIYKQLVAPRNT